jgi:Holliday junction resolvasome RuvABC endonuclease subunit
MKEITCTLSRWHKVTERLNAEISRVGTEIEHDLMSTSVDAYLGEDQSKKLDAVTACAIERMNQHRELLETVAIIKKMLARENSKSGISDKLTDLEIINRRIKFIKNLVAHATDGKVEKSALEEVFKRKENQSGLGVMRGVNVQMLSASDMDAMKQTLLDLQAKAYAIGDEISDLNKKKTTLEIDDVIAKAAGF